MGRVPFHALAAWLLMSVACSKDNSQSAATATATPTATATATATPTATPTATAKSAHACGDKPLPPCPLYAWMKANTAPALSAHDFAGLVVAFGKLSTIAPPDYANWRSIALDGADAARIENVDAVKAACRGCHSQYRDRYKKETRERPI